jgi:HprK-related kinase B
MALLIGDQQPSGEALYLNSGGGLLRIRSNAPALLSYLRDYFAPLLCPPQSGAIEVLAIERETLPPELGLELGLEFLPWQREVGKTGGKDSYIDLPQARLLRKVRTGMVFLQAQGLRIAAGPCLTNANQLVNFINTQLMNRLQQQGWLICHAAALVYQGRALALAGYSGGGKSTLMLHLLEQPGCRFLSNDRLFLRDASSDASSDSSTDSSANPAGAPVQAQGVPKLPRINPGTLLGNPRLHPLASAAQLRQWRELPADRLWTLEEKYDVPLTQLYGPDCMASYQASPLAAFIVLGWSRDSSEPTRLQRVELEQRSDLLCAIMKSPGPFYQDASGQFLAGPLTPHAEAYRHCLSQVPLYEALGRVDFHALIPHCLEVLTP